MRFGLIAKSRGGHALCLPLRHDGGPTAKSRHGTALPKHTAKSAAEQQFHLLVIPAEPAIHTVEHEFLPSTKRVHQQFATATAIGRSKVPESRTKFGSRLRQPNEFVGTHPERPEGGPFQFPHASAERRPGNLLTQLPFVQLRTE